MRFGICTTPDHLDLLEELGYDYIEMSVTKTMGLSEEVVEPGLVTDFASFTGIMALVSLVVTQLSKLIPGISEKKWAKPLVSIAVGILSCLFGWILQISPVLEGLIWYMVILYGVFAGLSACGLYSILKPLIESIFPPKRE